MKKQFKILVLLTCFVLCFSLVVSSAVIYGTHSHSCIGEDCHICQAFFAVKEILTGGAFLNSAIFVLAFALSGGVLISLFGRSLCHLSLIKEKVKLTI